MSTDLESISVQLLNQAPFGVIVWYLDDPADDASLRLHLANRAASTLLGIDLDACIGQVMTRVFPSVPPERVRLYAEVCRERTSKDLGQVLYGDSRVESGAFSVNTIPVLDRGVAVVFENLTPLERADAEARRLNRFLDSILEHLPAMVFVKDAERLRF